MAHVLGVDKDTGARVSHGRWKYEVSTVNGLLPKGAKIKEKEGLYIIDANTRVLMEEEGAPTITCYDFGKGKGIYMSSFQYNLENTRLLLNMILHAGGELKKAKYITDQVNTECAYYPESKTLIVINNSGEKQTTAVGLEKGEHKVSLEAYETKIFHQIG
ncbi:MAG: D-galactosyl-beta-1-4-L-rhamnose phosphorylase, partial [Vallitaleaceae bacterium]|nr:D-galactosyl-beta-1-4-L-rhamnose phosphorylase [Vallitaleaceae bacterium]